MTYMRRIKAGPVLAIAVCAFAAATSQVGAAFTLSENDHIRLNWHPGQHSPTAGEFGVQKKNTDNTWTGDLFYTFCVEVNSHITLGTEYLVHDISTTVEGPGGTTRTLSDRAAYLYATWNSLTGLQAVDLLQFYKQTFSGLTPSTNTKPGGPTDTWATSLQNAIWLAENQITSIPVTDTQGQAWYNAADYAVTHGWTNIFSNGLVNVLNLSSLDGLTDKQSQLYLFPAEPDTGAIPEATSFAVWSILGSGGIMVGLVRSRKRNRQTG